LKSDANKDQRPKTGAFLLVLATGMLTVASLIGPDSLIAFLTQSGIYIWGLVVVLTLWVFWNIPEQLGILPLVQAGSLLVGIGLLLYDFNQVPFGFFGGLIWGAVLLASFVFGLIYFAQFILPLKGNDGWSEGFNLLFRNYSSASDLFEPTPKMPPSKNGKKDSSEIQLPASFSKLNAGNLKSYEVLALTKGAEFARSAGPGFVMLYRKEKIASVLDLRKHMRTQRVKAITRDGIPVETNFYVTFRVRQTQNFQADNRLQHPYDKEAIFALIYAISIDDKDQLRSWKERVCPQAAALLVDEFSKYTLDDLFKADDAGLEVLDKIKQNVIRVLEPKAEKEGIDVLEIGFEQFILPEQVALQRIKNWQADWQRKIENRKSGKD